MKKIISFLLIIIVLSSSLSFQTYARENITLKIENLKSFCAENGIKIKWKKDKNALKYIVSHKDKFNNWSVISETTNNEFVDETAVEGKIVNYSVQAVSNVAVSEFYYTSCCFVSAPIVDNVSNNVNGVKISWKHTNNASGYTLMRKAEEDTAWKTIAKISATSSSFVDKNVVSGVGYYYSLRKTINGYKSAYFQDVAKHIYVATVKNLSVKNSPKGVTLNWNKQNNVKSFLIFRKIAGEKNWSSIASLKGKKNSFIDKTAKFGVKNAYYIQVVDKENLKSANSSKVYLYAVDPNKPMIALTYDDGPADSSTNSILDTLKKYNARATFFVVGSRISSYSKTLKREARLGCEIACHTYTHLTLTSANNKTIKKEISKTNNLIEKYTGQKVKLSRAPGGAHNTRVREAVGLPMIGWSIDTRDWEHRSSQKSYDCVVKHASDGDIILMHDIHSPTADASKSIIPYLAKKGYQLVTVSEMFDAKGITLKKAEYYYSA